MSSSEVIWRIDDRLIHGQVVIGWCGQLPIRLIVVCDDDIAASDWEKNLLLIAAPQNIPTHIITTEETAQRENEWYEKNFTVLVLMKNPFVLTKLLNFGVNITKVNIGGIHYRDDRTEYLSYLYLSKEERDVFEELIERGIKFECRDLPNSTAYDLKKVLERKR